MIQYFIQHGDNLINAFTEHLIIVGETLLISIILAAVISYLLLLPGPEDTGSEKMTDMIIHFFSVIYSIPSMALFAILIPILGLGNSTAIPVLVAYNQYLLIRNIMTGMQGVDKSILEAGIGMGMNRHQLILKVRLPLAMPSVIAGIRLSIISTTGIAVIAATINAGGLGRVLMSGMRTMNLYKITWGTLLSVLIALIADLGLRILEKRLRLRLH